MSDNAKKIFGQNLAFLLDRLGKSQVDVARELDVATGTVSEWVRGHKYPRIDKMQSLSELFPSCPRLWCCPVCPSES